MSSDKFSGGVSREGLWSIGLRSFHVLLSGKVGTEV